MRWSDERYVRLYVRDTIAWRVLPWQARALFPLVLRKLDRAGLMPLDGHGAPGLAALVDLPLDVVAVGYPALLSDGCLREVGGVIVCANFIEAQEAAQSDKQRMREMRARAREIAAAGVLVTNRNDGVTNRNETVTPGYEPLRPVTSGYSVPSRAVPSPTEKERDGARTRVIGALAVHAHAPMPPASLVAALEAIAERAEPTDPGAYAVRFVEVYAEWRQTFGLQPAWSADAVEKHSATVHAIVSGATAMPRPGGKGNGKPRVIGPAEPPAQVVKGDQLWPQKK